MKNLFEIYDNETKIGEMKVYAVVKNYGKVVELLLAEAIQSGVIK